MMPSEPISTTGSALVGARRGYLELLRLPNWFTAVADVVMGYMVMQAGTPPRIGIDLLLLVGTSLALYGSGMVLNDVFDFDVDSRQRPQRPLPSGRVDRGAARRLGWRLWMAGLALGWMASALSGSFRPGLVAVTLAVAIVLYDGLLKQTPLAPLLMGSCRGLNVLLGMSVPAAYDWDLSHAAIALGVAIYIAGVTTFARSEASLSRRGVLALGVGLMMSGLAVLATFPLFMASPDAASSPLFLSARSFPWLILTLGALLAWRWAWALVEPSPVHVQTAVRLGIWTLILLDAAVIWAVQGPFWAAPVALLVIPTALLGRWLYAT